MARSRRPSKAVAIVNRRRILAAVAKGRLLADIGAEYGVTKQALCNRLRKTKGYRTARGKGALVRLRRAWKDYRAAYGENVRLARLRLPRKPIRELRRVYQYSLWVCREEFPERLADFIRTIALPIEATEGSTD